MEHALHCLLDTPLLTICHDTSNGWLYNQWKGSHTYDTVFICVEHILACLDATACTKMLSDHTQLTGDWEKAASRLGSESFGQVAVRGVSAVAWVYGPDYRDLVAMRLTQHVAEKPTIAIFDDVATACIWLQQRP